MLVRKLERAMFASAYLAAWAGPDGAGSGDERASQKPRQWRTRRQRQRQRQNQQWRCNGAGCSAGADSNSAGRARLASGRGRASSGSRLEPGYSSAPRRRHEAGAASGAAVRVRGSTAGNAAEQRAPLRVDHESARSGRRAQRQGQQHHWPARREAGPGRHHAPADADGRGRRASPGTLAQPRGVESRCARTTPQGRGGTGGVRT